MLRILITGGLGYLGGRLAHYLSQQGNTVVVASRSNDKDQNFSKDIVIQTIDWESEASINQVCKDCDVVIHAAGMNANSCKEDPVAALNFNGIATAKLIRGALLCNVSRFIYFSTAHVYSECLSGYFNEDSCTTNVHPYATTHRVAEDMVLYMTKEENMSGMVLRLSNVFGSPIHSKVDCWDLFINDICRQAVSTGSIRLKTLGKQYRNFLPMESLCSIVEYFITSKSLKNTDRVAIYNIGSETSRTIREMAILVQNRVKELFDRDVSLIIDGIDNSDNKLTCSKPLVYSVDKLFSEDIAFDDCIDKEIKALLLFCKEKFYDHK